MSKCAEEGGGGGGSEPEAPVEVKRLVGVVRRAAAARQDVKTPPEPTGLRERKLIMCAALSTTTFDRRHLRGRHHYDSVVWRDPELHPLAAA